MPVRVLHVVTYMGIGGLETMIMNYYRHMDRNKVQFDFLVHRDEEFEYDQEILDLGGKIYRLPRLNPFSPQYWKELNRFFAVHPEYQIVHSHLDCMAGIPLKAAKANGVPVRIAHSHNANQVKDAKYLMKLCFKRNIPKHSNYRFACSKEAGDWMFGGQTYSVLNNAIEAGSYVYDEEVRDCIRSGLGFSEDNFVIGNVGRFFPQKNHTFLLDVFAKLSELNQDARLLLVGDGILKDSMEAKCRQLGLADKVIFTGIRKDVNALLQSMDLFILPSLFEGLGIVAIEAQAAGLRCLISDTVPSECSITENLVSELPLHAGPEAWAERILELKNYKRTNMLESVQNAGYDIEKNARKLQAFYLHMNEKYGV